MQSDLSDLEAKMNLLSTKELPTQPTYAVNTDFSTVQLEINQVSLLLCTFLYNINTPPAFFLHHRPQNLGKKGRNAKKTSQKRQGV